MILARAWNIWIVMMHIAIKFLFWISLYLPTMKEEVTVVSAAVAAASAFLYLYTVTVATTSVQNVADVVISDSADLSSSMRSNLPAGLCRSPSGFDSQKNSKWSFFCRWCRQRHTWRSTGRERRYLSLYSRYSSCHGNGWKRQEPPARAAWPH